MDIEKLAIQMAVVAGGVILAGLIYSALAASVSILETSRQGFGAQ